MLSLSKHLAEPGSAHLLARPLRPALASPLGRRQLRNSFGRPHVMLSQSKHLAEPEGARLLARPPRLALASPPGGRS
jgi:hypothetical protein